MKDPDKAASAEQNPPQTMTVVSKLFLHHPERQAPHTYQGSFLFADISGFTTLAETLAKKGEEGCEALNSLLSSYFSLLICAIDAHGGYLLGLAGDALNVLFHDESAGATPSALRATLCAKEIQRITEGFEANVPLIGKVRLSIKLAIAPGEVTTAIAGCPVIGKSFLTYGTGLDAAAEVEKYTEPGQVCIDRALADTLSGLTVSPVNGRVYEVHELSLSETLNWTYPPERATPEQCQPQIPPQVWQYLSRGAGNYLNSIRPVTAMFVAFNDFKHLGDARHATINAYFTIAQKIIHRHGGLLIEFDAGDKGNKFIGIFGAPNAVDQKESRAIESALALQKAGQKFPHISKQHIGLASGHLYSGLIGGAGQIRYSLMGDRMNLSARLMGLAKPGEILLDGRTHQRASKTFQFGPPKRMKVKGKSEEITVRSVKGHRTEYLRVDERRGSGVLGREMEQQRLLQALETAMAGQSEVVLIEGEAGIGKTRVLSPLMVQCSDDPEITLLQGQCADYTKGTAYRPWLAPLLAVLNLKNKGLGPESLIAALNTMGVDNSSYGPLLYPVMGLDTPLPEFLAQLEARQRQNLTEELIIALLSRYLESHKVVLIFENLQWMDKSSANLLLQVLQRLQDQPLFLLLTHRPMASDEGKALLSTLKQRATVQALTLSPLDEAATREVTLRRLGATSLDPQLVELVYTRSAGNPLLIEELCDLLKLRKHIKVQRGYARLALQADQIVVPDSATDMVLARVEQLDADVRMCLQAASVLGSEFKLMDLKEIYLRKGKLKLTEAINVAHESDIIRVCRDAEDTTYFFKHSMAQEAIYSSLSFKLRRQLHERIAIYFERLLETECNTTLIPLIAENYHRIGQNDKLLHYGVKAGEIALNSHLYEGATNWFLVTAKIHETAQNLKGQAHCISLAQNAAWMAGNLDSEGQILERWADIEALKDNPELYVKMLGAKALYLHRRGQSEEALSTSREAGQLLTSHQDHKERTLLYLRECSILMENKRIKEAEDALKLAEEGEYALNDAYLRPKLLSQRGALLMSKGQAASAIPLLKESLDLYRTQNDLTGVAYALGNLGIIELQAGHFEAAAAQVAEAAKLSGSLGNLRHEARHRYNLAWAELSLGLLDSCQVNLTNALKLSQRCDWVSGELETLMLFALKSLMANEPDKAKANLDHIERLAQPMGSMAKFQYSWLKSECELALNNLAAATGALKDCSALAEKYKVPAWQLMTKEVQAQIYLSQDDLTPAAKLNEEIGKLWAKGHTHLPIPLRSLYRKWQLELVTQELESAANTLVNAAKLLDTNLSSIKDEKTRNQYIKSMPWHNELLASIEKR